MTSRKWAVAAFLTVALTGLGLFSTFRAAGPPREREEKSKPDAQRPLKAEKTQTAKKETVFPRRDEEQAIRKAAQDCCAAFNKADLDTLMGFWAREAEYTNEEGKSYRGQEAIRRLLKKSLADYKGSKQSIKIRSIRFIKPDVVAEEGTVFMTSPEGDIEPGRYSAVWVKTDGKWRINTVRDLPELAQEEGPAAFHKLRPLAWMVGEWQEKDGKGEVSMDCRWAPNQTFLLLDFTIKRPGGTRLRASERIGWDAQAERLRSWLFDSSGGFGEGYWTRQGNSWQIENEGVLADGRVLTATHIWKYVDDSTVEWSSTNREVDESPMPDLNVTFIRKAKGR
jgi:uncharacterized protein (TIGR02246 family)